MVLWVVHLLVRHIAYDRMFCDCYHYWEVIYLFLCSPLTNIIFHVHVVRLTGYNIFGGTKGKWMSYTQ